tara:strand:- start:557 stop:718 length:162 start_codon:yes stop_codon:yes gene_type:complete
MISQETFTLTKCINRRSTITNPRPIEKELGRRYEYEDYISMFSEKIKTKKIIA